MQTKINTGSLVTLKDDAECVRPYIHFGVNYSVDSIKHVNGCEFVGIIHRFEDHIGKDVFYTGYYPMSKFKIVKIQDYSKMFNELNLS